jgi:ATP-dependent helicase/nuclease subunit B
LSDDPHTHLIRYDEDPLDCLAQLLLERHKDRLPDLSNCIVLFPGGATNQRFRRVLLHAAAKTGFTALVPPTSGSLDSWLAQYRQPGIKVLGHSERELLLLEALADFPDLRRRYGTWPLIDSLFALFDELTLNRFTVPDDSDEFVQTIEVAYGSRSLKPLSHEASLVHTLWQAWQARLREIAAQDPPLAHAFTLDNSIKHLQAHEHIYLAGFLRFNRVELEWIQKLRQSNRVDIVFHGDAVDEDNHPASCIAQSLRTLNVSKAPPSYQSEYSAFLDNVFDTPDKPLVERAAAQHARTAASPAHGKLQICAADRPEQEARVIDIQVRRWLLEGVRNIGIVTNDRRLARRVRALLERADVMLVDTAGWTLSTTSAASVVVHWLDCIEHRLHHAKLLECLKSPFLASFINNFGGLQLVGQFEQAVVYRYGISSELERYRTAVESNQKWIDETCGEDSSGRMLQMLDALAQAIKPLVNVCATDSVGINKYFVALEKTMSGLGLTDALSRDDAGKEVLREIRELQYCSRKSSLTNNCEGFRSWLMRNLERKKFRPPLSGGGVELMGLAESRLYQFDALVVAGVSREHLPGSANDSPFFNEGVRRQLDLPSRYLPQRERFADFRRLLEAGKKVLLTVSKEQNGSPAIPSPWLERLQAFHSLAYQTPIFAPELLELSRNPQTLIHRDTADRPAPESAPEIRVNAGLLPQKISATAYQKLVDCPFSFFASNCLALAPIEEIGDEVDKAEYGSRVHKILQAFHGGVAGLPGPFQKPLTETTLKEATVLLAEISEQVFQNDIKRVPSTRGWYYTWQRTIPYYLDWQLEREKQWRIAETESEFEVRLLDSPPLCLVGRLDRVDESNGKLAIIDYKTGKAPTRTRLRDGESVQLPFYAMLGGEPRVSAASALEIGDGEVNERGRVEDEELKQLIADHTERLKHTFIALASGANAPAWSDPDTCRFCRHSGICRRDLWEADYAKD